MSEPTPEQIVASVTPESVYEELGEHGSSAYAINQRINLHPKTEAGAMISWKLAQCLDLLQDQGLVDFTVQNGVKTFYRTKQD